MGAVLLKTPELELTEEESAKLAAAIAHVNELYGGVVLPEKAAAWINLIMVAGTIYGPRIIVIGAKKKIREIRESPAVIEEPTVIFAGPIVAHQARTHERQTKTAERFQPHDNPGADRFG